MRRNITVTATVAGLAALCAMLLPAMAAAAITTGVSGTVTNAEPPHAAIAGANVCLDNTGAFSTTCGTTNASGEYEIEVPAGSYRVEFTKTGFVTRYYNEVANPFEATTVSVTASKVTPSINAKLEESGPGTITGQVTNASNGQGAAGVEVCTWTNGSHCAETNGNGEYTLSGLSAGFYMVNFSPANSCEEEQGEKIRCQPKSNYIGQSKSATVKANKTETLNVALQPGGQIGGTVTNASIAHPPIAKIEVCASKVNGKGEIPYGKEAVEEKFEYGGGCAYTNASGQYTIDGLITGSYKVHFRGEICTVVQKEKEWECPEVYVGTWYQGQQTLRKGGAVSVTQGSNTGSIDESLREAFPTAPVATAAPALTGTPAIGQVLTCSPGSWSHEPTYLVYQWLRNGTVISGQTGSTYTVQAADRGHSIACSVTAGNGAGAVTAMSNAVAIPVPIAVVAGVTVKGSNVSVKLSCPGVAPCSGVMKIVLHVAKQGKRKAHDVTIGVASFSIAAGKSVTKRVPLTGTGRSALAHSGRRGLKVKIAGTGLKPRSATLHRHR